MKAAYFTFLLSIASASLFAQSRETFTTLKLHSAKSKVLIDKLTIQLGSEYWYLGDVTNKEEAKQLCSSRSYYLLKSVRQKFFIENREIEDLLDRTVAKIVEVNSLEKRERIILILNNPELNAFCYGRGVFVVTIGLLSKIHNEDELAAILCHEIAHDELRHVQENIIREADLNFTRKLNAEFRHVFSDNGTPEDVARFKKMIYDMSKYSREKEIDADSLGFMLYRNSGYNQKEAINSLYTLDSAYYSKYDAEKFFAPIDLENFPFQENWIKPRLRVFSQKPQGSYLFSLDSVGTHPDLVVRRALVSSYIDSLPAMDETVNISSVRNIVSMAEFQRVEGSYVSKQYDKCLFQILLLMNKYPSHSYLTSRTAKIFIDISEAKNEKLIDQYVTQYTGHYTDQLRHVNNLLFNISRLEAAELAYNLMNNRSNFNAEDQSHYFLLWRICGLTSREETREKVAEAYKKKFRKNISTFDYQ